MDSARKTPPTQPSSAASLASASVASEISTATDNTRSSGESAKSPEEDLSLLKVRRAWRSLASAVIVESRAAEKYNTAKVEEKSAGKPSSGGISSKELDDAVVMTLQARAEFQRYVSLVEGKLTGQEKEQNALQVWCRTQPSFGKKRKRKEPSS